MTAIRNFTHYGCLWGNDDDESNDEEEGEEEEGFIPPSHPYDNQITHTLYRSDGLRKLLLLYIPIGSMACKALASFLQNPASNLEVLSLERRRLENSTLGPTLLLQTGGHSLLLWRVHEAG